MKKTIVSVLFLFSTPSFAGQFSLSAALGFFSVGNSIIREGASSQAIPGLSGLLGIGGDVDYQLDNDMSIGGYVRYHGTGDDFDDDEISFSSLSVGFLAKGYLHARSWSFYYGAGFGIISAVFEYEVNGGSTTKWSPGLSMGPSLVFGGYYPLNDRMSLGVENLHLFALGEDLNGEVVSDWMVKLKFAL